MKTTITRDDYNDLKALRSTADLYFKSLEALERSGHSILKIDADSKEADWLFDFIWNETSLDYVLESLDITVEEEGE